MDIPQAFNYRPNMIAATQRRAVALAGASGYSGQEFLKWIARHPQFEVAAQIGRETNLNDLKGKVEAVVLATPAEVSLEMTPKILSLGIKVVDISGAFRLKRYSYSEWYGFEHSEKTILQDAVYGLYPWIKPDLNTSLVANPGCYTTTILMGLLPLLKEKIIEPTSISIDAASGASGAGKKLSQNLMFAELTGNSYAYKTGKHQHWPELVEYLELISETSGISPVLSTKLLPVYRGILASLFLDWHPSVSRENRTNETLQKVFKKHYQDHSDILICDSEVQLSQVTDSNKVALSTHVAYGKPLIYCALDNLVRGAAGQAVMNLNQIFGLPAQKGLT